ncbi:MAG: hypothetical protein WCB27_06970, partial [Thermoguttaceae bacterium]
MGEAARLTGPHPRAEKKGIAMPRLTEQEQQEIIRFIEADKPLPEKYRFLLFEDKREVELVWNGKTSEVCNIVLPFQVIEQVDEPRVEKPVSLRQACMKCLEAFGIVGCQQRLLRRTANEWQRDSRHSGPAG